MQSKVEIEISSEESEGVVLSAPLWFFALLSATAIAFLVGAILFLINRSCPC